ncbi:hypothetical protein BZM27_04385 [Paraburkholderia steynii]|uniref:Major facilitator superfamily (MFS) profile domain-containing protein n=1 Tax=Paraburkholderia steynii TaxID=1245441 RepID=A0A4V2NHP1_9BURK|nr:hypothetical protein BZM27_04385 [Paraburkholderia steynii]
MPVSSFAGNPTGKRHGSALAAVRDCGMVLAVALAFGATQISATAEMSVRFLDAQEAIPDADVLTLIVLVIPALMIALFSPLVGSLVDAFGRKRLYMTAVAIYAVAGVLPFWLKNLYAIVVSRAVIGLAEAAIVTVRLRREHSRDAILRQLFE